MAISMYLERDFSAELAQMNQFLATDLAIISEVQGDEYTVVQTASEPSMLKPGDRFVCRDTYCNAVLDEAKTIVFNEVGKVASMVLHPVYTAMQLEAYIGTPLVFSGRIVGTLNFSGFAAKVPGFSAAEQAQVEAFAQRVVAAIKPPPAGV